MVSMCCTTVVVCVVCVCALSSRVSVQHRAGREMAKRPGVSSQPATIEFGRTCYAQQSLVLFDPWVDGLGSWSLRCCGS